MKIKRRIELVSYRRRVIVTERRLAQTESALPDVDSSPWVSQPNEDEKLIETAARPNPRLTHRLLNLLKLLR